MLYDGQPGGAPTLILGIVAESVEHESRIEGAEIVGSYPWPSETNDL